MSTRRLLEVWESNRSIEFRGRLLSEVPPGADTPLLTIRVNAGIDRQADWCLGGHAVEELHQFTYDILAGPRRDPRLEIVDAQIMCGERTHGLASGDLECCLYLGHDRVGDYGHITLTGVRFDNPRF